MKTKKKVFAENWSVFSPKSVKDQKKRSSPQFGTIWLGFIRAGWLLFVSSSSSQISMGGRLNLDGGTLTLDGGVRPPASSLQFKYCF